jgi:transposase
MPNPYPLDLRIRVVHAYEAGEGSAAQIAVRFRIGHATVERWVALLQSQGHVRPRTKGGGTPSPISTAELEKLIEHLRDPTAGELTAAYNQSRHRAHRVHVSSMKRALHRSGFVVKKSADGRWRVSGRTLSPSAPSS